MKPETLSNKLDNKEETAVLVGLITQQQNELKLAEYLEELEFLTLTAGAKTLKHFIQRSENPNPKTFVGKGKMEEIRLFVEENKVDMVIFDDELSPSQLRNIEAICKCKILDRNNLILDIFSARARTAHAKKQVELAQYEYLLPRLTRMWTHLERQKGGIGMRGPGETEIETDRRIIRNKIALLKEQLKEIDKQMATQRKNRGELVRVALVGYTNVGKSSLMNLLSKSDVFAENKLFATLDTTVRKVVIGNLPFLLSDTVGFIRKLPTQLIESFKSTLDELRESDLLVHVVDISHHNFEEHMETVISTINDIGASDKKNLTVFNKIDLLDNLQGDEFDFTGNQRQHYSLDSLRKSIETRLQGACIFISVKEKLNFDGLKDLVYQEVKSIHQKRYPYDHFLY